jgi:hypothetical protein
MTASEGNQNQHSKIQNQRFLVETFLSSWVVARCGRLRALPSSPLRYLSFTEPTCLKSLY